MIRQLAPGMAQQVDLAGEVAAAVANGQVQAELDLLGQAQFAVHRFGGESGGGFAR